MTWFATTTAQRERLPSFAAAMQAEGLPAGFLAAVAALAADDQGVYELMELWMEASDARERDRLVVDLQDAVDEAEEAPRRPQVKPKIEFDELESITRNVQRSKARLADLLDRHGGPAFVAKKAGLPVAWLTGMLTSSSMPRKTALYKIARALDVSETVVVTDWTR